MSTAHTTAEAPLQPALGVSPQSSHPDGPDPPGPPPKPSDVLVGHAAPSVWCFLQSAAELASVLHGSPWGWEDVDRPHPTRDAPVFPRTSREPQGTTIHPHAMYPPAPGLPGTSLEVFGLHGLSLLCSPCWDTSFPEPKGEMWKSAPLFSFFRKNTEQIYFCTSLTCPAT